MHRRRYLLVAGGVATLAGCWGGSQTNDGGANTAQPIETVADAVELEQVSWNPGSLPPGITGLAVNRSERTVDPLRLQAEYFDADGSLIGDASGRIQDLPAGATAEFDVFYYEDWPGRVAEWDLWVDAETSRFEW